MITHTPKPTIIHDDFASNADACLRAGDRHAATAVRCNLGQVIDLSTTGARILAKSLPRSPVNVEFYALSKSITVRATVAWSRRTGDGFDVEIGLCFGQLTRIQRETLKSLAAGRMHCALL
jgi:hypothetical protein